jgi:protein TonB
MSTSNLAGIVGAVPVALPTVAGPTRVTISQGISQGMLIHQVNPVYPAMAKQARIQGEVLVHALINKQGEVDEVKLVSGPSLLVRSALTAVKQWRYRPYLLNGQAVEVETLITIKFRL